MTGIPVRVQKVLQGMTGIPVVGILLQPKAQVPHVVQAVRRQRGYLQDDGTVLVDMEKLLGAPVQGK